MEEYDYESLGNNSSMLQNALAGALAGIAEHCAMYPVDSIKTRMQVIHHGRVPVNLGPVVPTDVGGSLHAHAAKSASRSLWRGVNSVVMGAGPAHAVHFGTYEFCREYFGADREGHHPLASAAAGACATLAHDTLMNPFDVVKQRMQLQDSHFKTIRDCFRQIWAKEGLTAFYISLPTTLAMSVPFQSIQFTTYEFFRRVLNPQGDYDPKTHAIAGGIAGALASSVTTPLDVAKTLLQTRGQSLDPQIRNASGIRDAVTIIHQRYGLRGFFRGLRPRVLTHMPSAAISWSVYEYFKWFLDAQQTTSQQEKKLLGV